MNDLAPIVLFVYNRPIHTRMVLNALSENELANNSKLIIYSDGAKDPGNIKELSSILEVREVIREKKWCGEVVIIEQIKNLGLADSITNGVTEIINKYGKVIVLEDDIVVEVGFLKYMNDALRFYNGNKNVYHISGHSFPIGLESPFQTYFLRYVSPWGWATWRDRWNQIILDPDAIIEKLKAKNDFDYFNFNSGYGNEFYDQLVRNSEKKLKTWAIKWHSSVYLNNGLTLFPKLSLVRNIGFDGSGTNCPVDNTLSVSTAKYVVVEEGMEVVLNNEALEKFHLYYLSRGNKGTNGSRTLKIIKNYYGRFQSVLMGKR